MSSPIQKKIEREFFSWIKDKELKNGEVTPWLAFLEGYLGGMNLATTVLSSHSQPGQDK